jgi:hypothetical protein
MRLLLFPKNDGSHLLQKDRQRSPERLERKACSSKVHQAEEAIHRPSDQQVGNDGENDRDDQRLPRIEPAQNDDLIDGIHGDRDQKDSADGFPTLSQQAFPLRWICKDGPEVGRPICQCVVDSGSNREEDSHGRLKNKAKVQWPGNACEQVLPYTHEEIFQGSLR